MKYEIEADFGGEYDVVVCGAELDYTYSDGKIQLTLDKVHIHTVVKAEY